MSAQHLSNPVCVCPTWLQSRLRLPNIFPIPFVSAQHGCNPVCVTERLWNPIRAYLTSLQFRLCFLPTYLQSRLCLPSIFGIPFVFYPTRLQNHSCLPNVLAVPFVLYPNIFAIPFVSTQHLYNPVLRFAVLVLVRGNVHTFFLPLSVFR